MACKLGLLLAAIRKECIDWNTGRPWTQQKLAQETGLSRKIISDIERGERQVDNDVLSRLAEAFQLNQAECQHLWEVAYDLQGFLFGEDASEEETAALLANMTQELSNIYAPALIYNGLYQLVAANSAWLKLSCLESNHLPKKVNMLELFFDPQYDYRNTFAARWNLLASLSIRYFRSLTFPLKYHPEYETLLTNLNQLPNFQFYWEISEQLHTEEETVPKRAFAYTHPICGSISYLIYAEKRRTAVGNVYMTVLQPQDGETADAFADLSAELTAVVFW